MKKSKLPEGFCEFGDYFYTVENLITGQWTVETCRYLPTTYQNEWKIVSGPFETYPEARASKLAQEAA